MNDWAPKLKRAASVPIAEAVQKAPPILVAKLEPAQVRGWRFVPVRDADNLIIEIIATPI